MKENNKRGPGRPRKDSHNYTPHEGVRIEIKEIKTEPYTGHSKTTILKIIDELGIARRNQQTSN